jgi:hypothetical protein
MLVDVTGDHLHGARSFLGWREVDRLASRVWSYFVLVVVPLSAVFSYLEGRMTRWAGIDFLSIGNLAVVLSMFAAMFAGGLVVCVFVMRWLLRQELARMGVTIVDADWRPTITQQAVDRLRRFRRNGERTGES